MKSTGIVRRVDDLGRVVMPKEIRRALNIREGDPLELCLERSENGEPILSLMKYVGDSGSNIFDNLMTKLLYIKQDCSLWEAEKQTIEKVDALIAFLKKNKDKFEF